MTEMGEKELKIFMKELKEYAKQQIKEDEKLTKESIEIRKKPKEKITSLDELTLTEHIYTRDRISRIEYFEKLAQIEL